MVISVIRNEKSNLGTGEAIRYCEFSVTAVSVIDGVLSQINKKEKIGT